MPSARFFGLAAAALVVGACTQDFGVFDPKTADAGSDGGADATSPPDAAADAGTDAAPPTEAGALTFSCGPNNVSDCSQCAGFTQPCVYCQFGNPSVLAGRCVGFHQSCFQGTPNGFGFCQCNNTASTCPESYQVCHNGSCRTCSDSNTNDGLTCQSGGTCDYADGGCL
jgi:hypothetical protein